MQMLCSRMRPSCSGVGGDSLSSGVIQISPQSPSHHPSLPQGHVPKDHAPCWTAARLSASREASQTRGSLPAGY